MATQQLTVIFYSLMLFSLTFTFATAIAFEAAAAEKQIDMAYCKSWNHLGTWSVTEAKPIPIAKVKYHGTYGYFYSQLEDFKMNHHILDYPLHSCSFRYLISNVSSGIDGAVLRYKRKRLFGNNDSLVV